ncbi:arginine--tRNA ligase [Curtobacterium sp. Leaf261]|uniref:arginine--tRNA ligase n=1 Tax=Curtobacterium sp. Leaf261 TaxID=1736311 RepID=UPI0006F5D896|nr:arginine--tRNA ligase [Curtobacterium sp. Leaf261]KQO64998.1 arginine--tRNA ligase [Curtobacterium sp. Leaf261]
MASPLEVLEHLVNAAVVHAFGADRAGVDPALRPSQFADAQSNCALALARDLRRLPRDIAGDLAEALRAVGLEGVASVETSGPGYLNFTFTDAWLSARLVELAGDARLGVPSVEPETIPIDYSAPNVAKEMHVGHLRTTIVGDSIARTLDALGHRVVRQNHIGDWGTPFGMLIEHLLDVGADSDEAALLRSDPNAFYQAARRAFDGDPAFAERARNRVVLLQALDTETLRIWQELVGRSKDYFNRVYRRLDVTLTDDDLAGESTYNDDLAAICDELEAAGIATVSNGALCVFLPGRTGRDGQPSPLIIRKSDGGYGYATTDLATVRHRVRDLGADRLVYVIGTTQSQHLEMVWETARLAGWLPDSVPTVHVRIGSVLGADHKILRTRSGDSVRLLSLLDDAVDRVRDALSERPDLSDGARDAIAESVGIAAVKYADLSVAHDTDYVFDADRMVATTGNTGPYLQYAATRIRSLVANAPSDEDALLEGSPVLVTNESERALVLDLLGYGSVVAAVGRSYEPHVLCAHLFALAQDFSRFYETSPILQADPELRRSRLRIAVVTLDVLTSGMGLLGITVPDRM